MRAGRLDTVITIERNTGSTRDDFNQPVESWTTLQEIRAAKDDLRDSERLRAQGVQATISTRFTFRWTPTTADLNAKDRIMCDGQLFDIYSVKAIGRQREWEVTANARSDT